MKLIILRETNGFQVDEKLNCIDIDFLCNTKHIDACNTKSCFNVLYPMSVEYRIYIYRINKTSSNIEY
ncbi:hypothetical protein V1478_017373 [Vespula squamosa]|uniref:Uncharacterized protein n=1 Tax=Vespula squamosa TaxID=30214 RepID=A0ABD2A0E6_VESSQ